MFVGICFFLPNVAWHVLYKKRERNATCRSEKNLHQIEIKTKTKKYIEKLTESLQNIPLHYNFYTIFQTIIQNQNIQTKI